MLLDDPNVLALLGLDGIDAGFDQFFRLRLRKVALQSHCDDKGTTRLSKILSDLQDLLHDLSLLNDGELVSSFVLGRFSITVEVIMRLLDLLTSHRVIRLVQGVQRFR